MRLSWNEIKARASIFAKEWVGAHYEKGQAQTFYNEFFEVFGITRRRVATFEEPVKKLGDKRGFIDLFWKSKLLVEQKSAGRDLNKARDQAFDYFPGLKEAELPRYILLCDFQLFELLDLETGEEIRFSLSELPANVQRFGFMIGQEKRVFKDQDPVNIMAAEQMGKLHDALEASGYRGHPLEQFLVRLLFCLFADDTGIFQPINIFEDLIRQRTREDGSDLGMWLSQLFQVLNTPEDERQVTLDEDLAAFPYVNGALFGETLAIPAFNAKMRTLLLDACVFKWEAISPAIFGSLFQSVMLPAERRKKGAHYTTEKNILKLIGPLFMDELTAEFTRLKGLKRERDVRLRAFHDKLAGLTFFDPACGCGNFLVITYRELRALEIELLRELYADVYNRPGLTKADFTFDVAGLSRLDVNQFYGIEIDEFPARIAEVAMWMMDHIMNNRLSLEFGQVYARIPLKASPNVVHGDALELDWASVIAPESCSYILGNPPFVGQSFQTPLQRQQMVRTLANGKGRAGSIDFVAAWFLKASAFISERSCKFAFVATNSITQGEQVAQLWPIIFQKYKLDIFFAHRTFEWGSDARGKAHVHCVIVGLVNSTDAPQTRRLFSYERGAIEPLETLHSVISPYLVDGSSLVNPKLVILDSRLPLSKLPSLRMGCKLVDDGHYLFDDEQKKEFVAQEPLSEPLFRRLVGSVELINNKIRWILELSQCEPSQLKGMPLVAERVSRVRAYRLKSAKENTRKLADFPTQFEVSTLPTNAYIAIPKVSSERRNYVPIGWLGPEVVPSQLVQVLLDASGWMFGLLNSQMHMSWLRQIGGRLKSDYQYSIGLVYNAFPVPNLTDADKMRLDVLAKSVLDARAAHPGATLADLYDPDMMPPDLRRAHKALDAAVDRLYRKEPFTSDRERVEHLFRLYEKMTAGLLAAPAKQKRARKSK